jgi:RNA polymerase subunit RPABC4/transcription elongation factor Spt4
LGYFGRLVCYNRYMATKYTKEVLSEAVENSASVAGVLRYLNLRQAGGTQHHISKKIKEYGIDTSHFTGQAHNKGRPARNKLTPEQILVVRPEGSRREDAFRLRRALQESGVAPQCKCGITDEWAGKFIQLEVNHKDGNCLNNALENLEFICPNCHSQESHTNKPHKYRSR